MFVDGSEEVKGIWNRHFKEYDKCRYGRKGRSVASSIDIRTG